MDSFLESTKALAIDAMGAIDQRMSSMRFHHDPTEELDRSYESGRSRFSSSSSSLSLPESPSRPRSHSYSVNPPERLRGAFEALSLREEDLKTILEEDGGLESLKKSLKRQGAVTNALIKQGLHLYVRERKMDAAQAKYRRGTTR